MKPVPPIFALIDEYNQAVENNQPADTSRVSQYIIEHPSDLYTIFAGMSVLFMRLVQA